MRRLLIGTTGAFVMALAAPVGASISTHVLDLGRGVGGAGVPVRLESRQADGSWHRVAEGRTDANGRVREFPGLMQTPAGTYRLSFDLSAYPQQGATPFFPQIDVVFRVSDPAAHYHVPVVVSPYGYGTYRGN